MGFLPKRVFRAMAREAYRSLMMRGKMHSKTVEGVVYRFELFEDSIFVIWEWEGETKVSVNVIAKSWL